MAKMTLLSLSLFLSCFSFFLYWCPRVGRNQWPWFIAAIYIKIPTLKLGEPPVDSWLHYRLRKERGAVVARNGLVYADARRLNPSFDVSPSSLLSPEWIVGVACASDPRPFPDIRDPVGMNFRYRMTNSIYEGDMNASICSRYHEQFFTICTILSFEISIDTDYPPFNTARWILLLKRRSRKKTLKSIIVPSKFNSILHTSTFLIYIYISFKQ